jgi:prepilin-type N-terminal cleavage/methylation domain-containing protein/prepilin-type processing-associated H-X9-DG protein
MARHRRTGFTLIELLVVVAIISLLIAILVPSLGKVREKGKSVQCLSNVRQIGLAGCVYLQENSWCFPYSSPQNSSNTSDWLAWQPARLSQIGTIGLGPYMRLSPTNYKVMICPSDYVINHPKYPMSYVLNWYIAGNSNADPSTEIAREQKMVRFPGDTIWFYEEGASTIDDGNGSIMQPPNAFNWLNLLSTVHDAAKAKGNDGNGAGNVPSPLPNPQAKGNVSFVDGHAELVTRRFAHSTKHTFPKPSVVIQTDP